MKFDNTLPRDSEQRHSLSQDAVGTNEISAAVPDFDVLSAMEEASKNGFWIPPWKIGSQPKPPSSSRAPNSERSRQSTSATAAPWTTPETQKHLFHQHLNRLQHQVNQAESSQADPISEEQRGSDSPGLVSDLPRNDGSSEFKEGANCYDSTDQGPLSNDIAQALYLHRHQNQLKENALSQQLSERVNSPQKRRQKNVPSSTVKISHAESMKLDAMELKGSEYFDSTFAEQDTFMSGPGHEQGRKPQSSRDQQMEYFDHAEELWSIAQQKKVQNKSRAAGQTKRMESLTHHDGSIIIPSQLAKLRSSLINHYRSRPVILAQHSEQSTDSSSPAASEVQLLSSSQALVHIKGVGSSSTPPTHPVPPKDGASSKFSNHGKKNVRLKFVWDGEGSHASDTEADDTNGFGSHSPAIHGGRGMESLSSLDVGDVNDKVMAINGRREMNGHIDQSPVEEGMPLCRAKPTPDGHSSSAVVVDQIVTSGDCAGHPLSPTMEQATVVESVQSEILKSSVDDEEGLFPETRTDQRPVLSSRDRRARLVEESPMLQKVHSIQNKVKSHAIPPSVFAGVESRVNSSRIGRNEQVISHMRSKHKGRNFFQKIRAGDGQSSQDTGSDTAMMRESVLQNNGTIRIGFEDDFCDSEDDTVADMPSRNAVAPLHRTCDPDSYSGGGWEWSGALTWQETNTSESSWARLSHTFSGHGGGSMQLSTVNDTDKGVIPQKAKSALTVLKRHLKSQTRPKNKRLIISQRSLNASSLAVEDGYISSKDLSDIAFGSMNGAELPKSSSNSTGRKKRSPAQSSSLKFMSFNDAPSSMPISNPSFGNLSKANRSQNSVPSSTNASPMTFPYNAPDISGHSFKPTKRIFRPVGAGEARDFFLKSTPKPIQPFPEEYLAEIRKQEAAMEKAFRVGPGEWRRFSSNSAKQSIVNTNYLLGRNENDAGFIEAARLSSRQRTERGLLDVGRFGYRMHQ